MKRVVTALGNPILNEELKQKKEIKILGNDIQYQDGILELLEMEKDIDYIILSEMLPGENRIEKLIEKIQDRNNEIQIILILENKKQTLESYLETKEFITFFIIIK